MTKKHPNEKFTDKYEVESATIYKTSDLTNVRIPGKDHFLYDPTAPTEPDPLRVAAIDRDGKMTTPIEVYSDPDAGILWVLDGRGRYLDVEEVNRLRAKEGREPVKAYLVPFSGTEKEALGRVRIKNYHRRSPTPSGTAIHLATLRKGGYTWDECAEHLHHETEDAEHWGRKLLPLAYCVTEVQAAIDDGEIPRTMGTRFGGSAPDGSKKLGKQAQIALLAEIRQAREKASRQRPEVIGPQSRERVRAALCNGAATDLKAEEREVAAIVAATLARLAGDRHALKAWPKVEAVVDQALAPQPKGPRPKEKG